MEKHISSVLAISVIVLVFSSQVQAQTNPSRKLMALATKAVLTINGFEKGESGGGPSECDGKFHSDDTLIVALSSRWYDHARRCKKSIIIHGNGNSVIAKVMDECDSSRGCADDIVDGSKAVWEALGVPKSDWGTLHVTWSDV